MALHFERSLPRLRPGWAGPERVGNAGGVAGVPLKVDGRGAFYPALPGQPIDPAGRAPSKAWPRLRPRGRGHPPGVVARSDIDAVPGHAGHGGVDPPGESVRSLARRTLRILPHESVADVTGVRRRPMPTSGASSGR